jgi:hypothetical protein
VITDRVTLNGFNLPDEKAVHVQIPLSDHEVFGSEPLGVGHGILWFRFELRCCRREELASYCQRIARGQDHRRFE